MSNKDSSFWAGVGWFLLIIVVLIAIPMPPLLLAALLIIIVFRIPRCLWDKGRALCDWDAVEKSGKEVTNHDGRKRDKTSN